MKNKIMVCLIVAMMMIFVEVPAWAEPGYGGGCEMMGGHHMGKGFGPMGKLKDLNLSDEQQAKVDAVIDQNKNTLKALDEKIDAARQSLHEAIHSDVFDEQKIREASKELAKSKEDVDVVRGRMFSDIRTVLTPEQTTQLKEMKNIHQEQRKSHEACGKMGKMEE